MDKAYQLHGVLLGYAPDGKAQEFCTAIFNAMGTDPNMTPGNIEAQVAMALSDGLQFGNWPWMQPFYLADPDAAISEYHTRAAAAQGVPVELALPLDNENDAPHTSNGKCLNCGQLHDGPDGEQIQDEALRNLVDQHLTEGTEDAAREAAISLMVFLGLNDPNEIDEVGRPVSDVIQTLLMIAASRSGKLTTAMCDLDRTVPANSDQVMYHCNECEAWRPVEEMTGSQVAPDVWVWVCRKHEV